MPQNLNLNESFQRAISIDGVNEENRTVEVSFSSEIEVNRWFGVEILDHATSSVRLERLNTGAPVLVDHNGTDHVGVIENARIDLDKKGRATLRFGRSARATEVFNDIVDKIRTKISVGYKVHKYDVTEGPSGQPDVYRVTDWEPMEISLVSIPADNSVGVGRSEQILHSEKEQMEQDNPIEQTETTTEQRSQPVITTPTAPIITNEQIRAEERQRIAAITVAADAAPWDLSAIRNDAINQGWSVERFRAAAFEHAASQPQPAAAVVSQEMLERNNNEYSLVRALNAQLNNDWSDAGFEREVSQELQRQAGSVVGGGLLVPTSIFAQRADTTNNAGLIGTSHLASQFIDVLRANTLMGRLGARFLTGLVGNLTMPKKTASATFGWVAEKQDATASDVTVGNITMSPKHISGLVPLTFELMRQSSPAIEGIVREDMITGMGLAIDLAAFVGTGTNNQPLGILNTVGVQTKTVVDVNNPTFKEVVAMEGILDDVNALMGSLSYVFRPTIYSNLKTTPKDSGSGRFVIEGNTCNGYTAHSSTQVPAGTTMFGNFSDFLVGTWGMVELIPDRNKSTGGLDIGIHQMMDTAVRHPQSFVKAVAA